MFQINFTKNTLTKKKEQWREKNRKIDDEKANAIKDKEREYKRKYEDDVRKYNKIIKDLQLIKNEETLINFKMSKLGEQRASKSETHRNVLLVDLKRLVEEMSNNQKSLEIMNEHLTSLIRYNILKLVKLIYSMFFNYIIYIFSQI